jgi:hypothetical protein
MAGCYSTAEKCSFASPQKLQSPKPTTFPDKIIYLVRLFHGCSCQKPFQFPTYTMRTISLLRDFTHAPGPRYRWQGDCSGEEFREEFLEEPLRNGEKVVVDLDGVVGLPSSFLDEAFGSLVEDVETGRLVINLTDNEQAIFNLNQSLRAHS